MPTPTGSPPADHLTHRPRTASRPPLRRHRDAVLASAALALLAGLLGLLALLSLLSPIAAQSATTLVSNAGQDSDSKHTDGRERSQAFTTGDSGATLSRVEIISEDTDFDDAAVSLCTVDGSNHPTSSCTPLTAPSRFLPGTLVFTAPADTTLEANTTYSVLIESPGKQSLLLDATPSDDEDDGRARNWTIDNNLYHKNHLDEWVAYAGPGAARSLRITIKGTLTNNAPTVATAIPDQTATTGAAFSYAFPAATFTDADSDTLSYAAAKSDDTALPSWLSFDPATRTFSGTPQTADVGTVSVKVTASDGSDSVSDTFDIVVSVPPDTTAPRVASIVRQNPTSSPTNADSLTWRVTFSEAVSNVNAADFAVIETTATVTAVATVSGVTGAYDVTTSGGNLAGVSATVTLAIASSHNIQDAASNALSNTAPTGTNDNSYVVDNTAPTVTISSVPATSTKSFLPKFAFSEAVTGFAVGDITLGNATASSFTTAKDKTAYWVVVTPTAAGTVTVDVSANAAQDAAGNGNTAATRASSTFTLPVITLPAITITAGTSPVTEGTPAVFTLSRTLSPTAELAVNVTVSETGGDMVAAANEGARTVTFLASSATATLSVATAPDSVDEADGVVTATVAADTGSPASYSVGTPASAMVTVEDDDTRRVTVSATALPVNEGSTGTYTVVLNSQPTASVTVTPSRTGSTDVTFSPPTLTFTTSTWNTVQTVTVTAAQDSDAVDDSATISHAVTGGDYAGVTADSVVVTVDDDETPDTTAPRVASIVRQNPTSSPTNADSLTWRVTFSEAVSNVDAADFAVRGATATMTAVATVSGVTGAYDVTASGGNLAGVSATVTLAIASSHNIQDAAGNALSNTSPRGTNDNSYVVDNTAPTVTISGVPGTSTAPFRATFTFSEAVTGFAVGDITLGNGAASSFTVTTTTTTVYRALVTPTAAGTVTVDVSANAARDAAGNGNTAATRASSTYTLPAITITAGTSPVPEGTSAVFTLSRTLSTTAELAVNVTVSETGGDRVAAANEGARTVTFQANSTTATLSVATARDSVDEANSVVTATVAADTGSPASYSVGTPASAMVTVEDDDTRRVTVSATALPVNEGSTGTYTVVLNSQPTASVTVTPSRTGSTAVTFSPATLTFTTSTWNTVQTVTVTAAQDNDAVDDSATISHAVTGGDYAGVTADSVVVTVDDDETADTTSPRVASIVRQIPTSSPTNADSLTWRVTFSEAVSNVDPPDFAVSGTTATVTSVTAVSGVTGAYNVTASGGNLASVSATVTLTIAASHNIEDAANNDLNNTAPTGTNDNSYVLDNTAPSVTISGVPSASNAPFRATFTFSEAVTGFAVGHITLSNATASSFTVTTTTVYTALVTPTATGTVTVDVTANAARDAAGNGNTAATRASSTFTLPVITLPAITITAGTAPVTEGTPAVFTLSRTLSTTAALAVNVTVSETGGDRVAAANEGARTVTFLANSATATLSVATVSDSVDEVNSVVTATVSAAGSPASYSVGTPGSAAVTVEDNDTRDVTVSPTALPVNEGSTGTYTVVLDSQPTASVTVTPSRTGSSDVTFSLAMLSFTTSTWSTAQTVTVTAAQDSDAVDDSATISHAVTGGDYASLTVDSVVVTVDDDETADTTAPRVASIVRRIPTSSPTNADSLTWRVTFSEAVSNVDPPDFAVSGATATMTAVATVSGVTGAYDVTASGGNLASVSSATVTLTIASSHNIEDAAGNALSNTSPRGTNDNSYVVDNTAPTVTISGVPGTSTAPFRATFTFSEAVTGFAVGDITLGNGTASSFTTSTSKTVYRVLVTPTATGTVTVDVSANAARDAAGNGNTAATRASSTFTLPVITITAGTSPVAEGTPAVFTLSRTGSTTAALAVNVTVSEMGGDMVAAANEGAWTVTFLANSATATLSVATVSDSVDEANSVVTAMVAADTRSPASYSVGTPASAAVTVQDDDTTRPVITNGGGGGGGGGGGPPPVPIPSDADFDWNVTRDIESLDPENDLPTGIWSDGGTLWVIENSASGADRVFAYDLLTGERQQDAEFELESRNRFSHGIWSDGETVWVADSGQDMLFAYNLESGERDEAREFELAERNRDPRGIWSDGGVMYVLDGVKDALFVYQLSTGELRAEHPLDKLNKSPRGIWSDGVTLWVSDDGAKRLFAYEVDGEALKRNEDLEFTFRSLLKAGNGNPRGIWSDGDVIYVVDEQDDRVYTYNIPDAIIAQLASLSLNELELEEFSPHRFEYAASVAYDLAATTVAAVATQETAKVMIEPADADGDPENGHQVTLGSETAITVTVTSADGSRMKSYVVQVSKPPCLSGLTEERLSEVAFAGGSISELEACARSLNVTAFYHYADAVWTAFFLDAPEFLSQSFGNRFAEGLPPDISLVAKREPAPIAASSTSGQEQAQP